MAAAQHIKVPRQKGLFQHHGIDLGDGTVAHYLEGREILRSPLKDFCGGESIKVVNHEKSSSQEVTLRRAIGRIGEKRYNLLFNNCEHFANWCKTGRHRSLQMENWLETTRLGAMALGQALPVASKKGLHLLISKGLIDEESRLKAENGLNQLKRLKDILLVKLDSTLKQLEQWIQNDLCNNYNKQKGANTRTLLITGQILADQLMAIEDLEKGITNLLSKSDN